MNAVADDTPTTITRDPTPIVRDPTPVIKRDPPAATPSKAAAFGTGAEYGLLDPIYGGAQIGARMGPDEGGAAFANYDDLAARQQAVDKAVKERNQRYYAEPAVKAHPVVAGAGDIAGQAVTTLPVTIPAGGAIAAGATLPARMLGSGALGSALALLEPTDDFAAGKKALQAATGFVGGFLGEPVGELIGKGVTAAGRWVGGQLSKTEAERAAEKAAKVTAKAGQRVATAIEKTAAASGKKPADVIEELKAAHAAGQPMAPWDIGGTEGELQRTAGVASRSSGEAGQTLKEAQQARIEKPVTVEPTPDDPSTIRTAQSARLVDKIRGIFGWQSAAGQIERGRIDRAVAARPLWDKAMEGGSVAPLEHQFTQEFNAATQTEAAAAQKLKEANTRLVAARAKQQTSAVAQREAATTPAQAAAKETGALGKQAVTGAAPPEAAPSGFNEAERAAANDVDAAQREFAQAHEATEDIRTRLKQAQADGSVNKKGAVWSPHLQRLFNRPDVRRGLNAGFQRQADLAAARNERFNPYEWGVTGTDAEGNPIVDKVPNMRMIQMAKEGLDHLLESPEFRDPITRKLNGRGLAVDEMRRALLSEGDRLNPDWKVARAQWAGDTAMLEAARDGQVAFKRPTASGEGGGWSTAEFNKRWSEMGEGERENFMIGVGNHMIEDLDYQLHNGDPTKALIRGNATRNKLLTMFAGDEKKLDSFITFVENEATMHKTGPAVYSGSQTAKRVVADRQAGDLVGDIWHGVHGLVTGHMLPFVGRMARKVGEKIGAGSEETERNIQLGVAKLISDPNVTLGIGPRGEALVGPQLQPPSTAPRYVGQATGDLGGLLFGERRR